MGHRSARLGESSVSLQAQRVRRTEEAFRSLPSRYLGADPGFDATFQIRLGDVGRTWEVRARGEHCEVQHVRHPRARRGHRQRCRYLGRPEGGAPLRPRRVRTAPPLRARRPRSRPRIRRALPSPGRPAAPAAGHRRRDSGRHDPEPRRRRRARTGGLPPRPWLEQGLVLRDGLGPDPRPHGPRDRPAGVRRLVETRARRLRRSVLRPRGAGLHGRRGASEQPTWWAIRWAAGSRWRWRSPTRTGPSP